jgi:hypothetical protein
MLKNLFKAVKEEVKGNFFTKKNTKKDQPV